MGGCELLCKVFNSEITQTMKHFLGQALGEPDMMMYACSPALGGGDRRIPGGHWLASLAEWVGFRSSETSCLKKI